MPETDPIRILIIDGNTPSNDELAGHLRAQGAQVYQAGRAIDSLEHQVNEHLPDVVLLDLTTNDVLEGIRIAGHLAASTPAAFVFLADDLSPGAMDRIVAFKHSTCLLKPVESAQVMAALKLAAAHTRQEAVRILQEVSCFELFQSLGEGIIGVDLSGRIRFMNPVAEKILSYSADEASSLDVTRVYQIRQLNGEPVTILPAMRGGQASQSRVLSLSTRDGRLLTVEDHSAPLRDEEGSVTGAVIFFKEIGIEEKEEKRTNPLPLGEIAVTAAIHQPAPLVDIVESISDPLMALDGSWNFTYMNGSAARLFKRDKKILLGQSLWDVLPPYAHKNHYTAFAHALLHRETLTVEIYLESSSIWFEARTYPFGAGMLVLLKDVTSRKLEAERLNRIDRLESLGLLARGFAHDFNNLLTVLLGNLSLAELKFSNQADKLVELLTAKQATQQAQSLVQQLLTFARGGAPIKRTTSLPELVKNFFHNHPRVPNVSYFVDVQEDLPMVMVDPNQIRRLLGNLVRNAEQATTNGGQIYVRCQAEDTATMFPHETPADVPTTLAGIMLEVQDTGEGIAPHNLPHIFEPYFTTRKSENATGLGLTVCESIAKSHGGTIGVWPIAPQGTRIRFFLPVDDDMDESGLPTMSHPHLDVQPQLPMSTRILVLEDDNLVRALIVKGLRTQGYEVIETVDGNDTVKLYQVAMQEGNPFHLVILDLSIPNGMGGLRTIEKLRSMDPHVLALVSSGYSDDPVMAQPSAYGFSGVLPKPYEPLELVKIVKSLLESRVNPS